MTILVSPSSSGSDLKFYPQIFRLTASLPLSALPTQSPTTFALLQAVSPLPSIDSLASASPSPSPPLPFNDVPHRAFEALLFLLVSTSHVALSSRLRTLSLSGPFLGEDNPSRLIPSHSPFSLCGIHLRFELTRTWLRTAAEVP